MRIGILATVFVGLLVFVSGAFADQAPVCLDSQGQPLAINNDQVLQWKISTPNGWDGRGHISGTVVKDFPDAIGHHHFSAQIGPNSNGASDLIEVIYDEGFGPLPEIQIGMSVEACGDFINSFAQNGKYAPSPDGAIIHWIHISDEPTKHPDGFILLNGILYGQDLNGGGDSSPYWH